MKTLEVNLVKLKEAASDQERMIKDLQNEIDQLEKISSSSVLKKVGFEKVLGTLKTITSQVKDEKKAANEMKKCLSKTISLYEKAEKNIIKEGQQTIRSIDPSDPNIVPTDQMLFDEENNTIYYKGDKYILYRPENLDQVTIGPMSEWETVYTDSYTDTEFDWLAAMQGVSLEGPEGSVYPGTRSNAYMIAISSGILGIISGVAAGVSSTKVTVTLQKDKTTGKNRAIIGVSNPKTTEYMDTYDYSRPFSTYRYLQSNGDGAAQLYFNKATAQMYEEYTNKKADATRYKYDLQFTLDERHKGSPYQAYVSIDEGGKYVQTNLKYSGDKTYIVVRDNLGIETGEKYEIPSKDDETMPIDSEFLKKIQKELNIK